MSYFKDVAVENINKLISYMNNTLQSTKSEDISSPPSTSSGCISGISEEDSEALEKISNNSSSITAETYLTFAEEVLSLSSVDELESAINHCKEMVLESAEDSEDRKWLVRRLIELRLRLQEMKEVLEEERTNIQTIIETNKVLLGHHFLLQNYPGSTSKHYCDRCSGIIWNMIHTWYLCTDCEYKCHVRCLPQVCRVCVHVLVSENPTYITEICPEPENGLSYQNYRCAECLTHTSFRDSVLEPRLCDYNGKYYCPTCHWNSTAVIPARIINNWDFQEKRVCRASRQILKLMSKLPILKLEQLNPVLFASVDELSQVKTQRQKLQQIKKYLTSCKSALEAKLLWQLGDRIHFIENEETYSVQDLLDLKSGELLSYLTKMENIFVKHIKQDCKVCHGRGYCCEMCKDKEIIFGFDSNTVVCDNCQSVFHISCWLGSNKNCPKCQRIKQRSSTVLESEETESACQDS